MLYFVFFPWPVLLFLDGHLCQVLMKFAASRCTSMVLLSSASCHPCPIRNLAPKCLCFPSKHLCFYQVQKTLGGGGCTNLPPPRKKKRKQKEFCIQVLDEVLYKCLAYGPLDQAAAWRVLWVPYHAQNAMIKKEMQFFFKIPHPLKKQSHIYPQSLVRGMWVFLWKFFIL